MIAGCFRGKIFWVLLTSASGVLFKYAKLKNYLGLSIGVILAGYCFGNLLLLELNLDCLVDIVGSFLSIVV